MVWEIEPRSIEWEFGVLKVRWNQKADLWAVDSPKKQTKEFDLFAVKS